MRKGLPEPIHVWLLWFGIALIVAGMIVNISAALHYHRVVNALARGERTRTHLPIAVALFLAFVGLAMSIYLIWIRSSIS